MLSHDWKKTRLLPINKLIVPLISNLESGDAFYVTPTTEPLCPGEDESNPDSISYTLVIFQITVAKTHSVKANGLRDILQAFPKAVRSKITRKVLVFITPGFGSLDAKQSIQTQKGSEASYATDFHQYICRLEI
jgi:hypothetical protein